MSKTWNLLNQLTSQLIKIAHTRVMVTNKSDEFHLNISAMRQEYNDASNLFTEDKLASKDPLEQFRKWMEDAVNNPHILEANAMCLATANREGVPSARFVLLKGYGCKGFEFYTNYKSRKAKDLEENPVAALTFYWEPLKRSVRIEGAVEKIGDDESAEYFRSRPRDSQFSASVSNQSSILSSRDHLMDQLEEFVKSTGDSVIPKPCCWGGYRLIPKSIEFWQGQSNRLHDRIKFRKLHGNEMIDSNVTHKGEHGWVYERLYP